ncbi:MAG: RNA 3'-terminal phosphate cyclase [Anaerolineae bacterium]|nr:RNA 3'-terminal phosphate cyclase [Anaerolineae bacterium]
MLVLNGAYGEGGGQILRSALTLSMLTGEAFRLENIRANRSKPGLRIQHLTALHAAANLVNAIVDGDKLGSEVLEFAPQRLIRSGTYQFDMESAASMPSAGSVTLVLQTLLLPLALAPGTSTLTLRGGTTVPMSPPALYIEKIYLPVLFGMGMRVKFIQKLWGFNPGGGGEISVTIKGRDTLHGLELVERGELVRVEGLAYASKLPSHIPQRMTNRARSILKAWGFQTQISPEHVPSSGLGTGLFLCARYQRVVAGFNTLGRKRLPSEEVAEMTCRDLLAHHRTGAVVDPYLADQLVLPFAVAQGESCASVSRVTQHLLTNVWVTQAFGINHVSVQGDEGEPGMLVSAGVVDRLTTNEQWSDVC